MFNLSGSEIIVILLLALVVLGPEKLPDALRRAGRTYAELKKMGNSFQAEVKSALDEPMKEMRETADLLRKSVDVTDEPAGRGNRAMPPRPVGAGPTPPQEANADEPDADEPDADEPGAELSADEELINRTLSGDAPAASPTGGDEHPTT